MTFRKPSADDIQDLCILSKQLGYGIESEIALVYLNEITTATDQLFLVAEKDNRIAGYIQAQIYCTIYFKKMVNILGLVVLENYRGQGVGSALIAKVEDWTKTANAYGIRLCSGFDRTDAHKFHKSRGFFNRKNKKSFHKYFEEEFNT